MKKLMALFSAILGMALLSFPTATRFSAASQGLWGQVWGPIGTVVIGWDFPDPEKGTTVYATKLPEGDVYVYNGTPFSWTKIGGPGKKFVTVGNTLYALSPDGGGVYKYTGTPGHWTNVGGAATAIYAGWPDLYATSPTTVNLWCWENTQAYTQSQTAWTKLLGITSYASPAVAGHSALLEHRGSENHRVQVPTLHVLRPGKLFHHL